MQNCVIDAGKRIYRFQTAREYRITVAAERQITVHRNPIVPLRIHRYAVYRYAGNSRRLTFSVKRKCKLHFGRYLRECTGSLRNRTEKSKKSRNILPAHPDHIQRIFKRKRRQKIFPRDRARRKCSPDVSAVAEGKIHRQTKLPGKPNLRIANQIPDCRLLPPRETVAEFKFRRSSHHHLLQCFCRGFRVRRKEGVHFSIRRENIRRIAEICKLFVDTGIVTLAAFVSPTRELRELARGIIGGGDFFEVHVATPIEECERRDVKGLYAKARRGEIPDFTGISAPFEEPESPSSRMDTTGRTAEACAEELFQQIKPIITYQ